MYKRLQARLILSEISKEDLAKKLGIGYNTLLLKLKGKNKFTLDEAVNIKKITSAQESIEELFAKDEDKTA